MLCIYAIMHSLPTSYVEAKALNLSQKQGQTKSYQELVSEMNARYGLDKGIYKHGVSRTDAQRIPRIIQQKPVETNEFGQNEYIARSKNGPFRVVTSPKDGESIISSAYYVER